MVYDGWDANNASTAQCRTDTTFNTAALVCRHQQVEDVHLSYGDSGGSWHVSWPVWLRHIAKRKASTCPFLAFLYWRLALLLPLQHVWLDVVVDICS
jgi:hypothetical protein